VTESQVTLRSRITLDDPSKIGKYTCSAQDAAGNTGSAVLTMQEGGGDAPQPEYPGGIAPAPRKLNKKSLFVCFLLIPIFIFVL
jgi:hypothetical protein